MQALIIRRRDVDGMQGPRSAAAAAAAAAAEAAAAAAMVVVAAETGKNNYSRFSFCTLNCR